MRRIFVVCLFLLFALPVGVSLSGCGKSSLGNFCSGSSGARIGDVQNITLQPTVGGISMGFAQTQSVTTPSATDCQGNSVSVTKYTYNTSNGNIADVNPATGGLCAGQWNRNNASGIPDYTFCTATNQSGVVELTASGSGANSNKVLVYVHPQITAITLGAASTDCANDPATNCAQYTANNTTSAAPYVPNTCVSFNQARQLVARFFAGTQNITYSAGHATFTAQTPGLVSFENTSGVATALAPGTTVVTATIAQSTSTAGLISVCPPRTITISTPNTVNNAVTVNPNNTEPITAVVTDINGVQITGLNLTVTSTTPTSIPASGSGITPVFPGVAAINAFCLPPACNPSPYGNIGLLGTGKPISSNTLTATTPGSNSTKLWIGSTDSIYLVPVDLTTGVVPSPTRLPFTPNSMIISQSGTTIFMGSSSGLMTYNTSTNSVASAAQTLQGTVLAVSPDSNSVVISDPTRQIITLYNNTGSSVISTYAGVGNRAAFTPDGASLYVTTTDNHLLVYSNFTSWQSYDLSATGANDVAIAVPSVGAFVTGTTGINGRSYCPNSNVTPTVFYPQASVTTVAAAISDRVAATNNGRHLLDVRLAASGGTPVVNDITFPASTANDGTSGTRTFTNVLPTGDCPESGNPPAFGTAVNTALLTGIATTGVTGIFPASDSSIAFTTYLPVANAPATGALLPAYTPGTTAGTGTVSSVALAAGATAPVSGVFSSDNKFFSPAPQAITRSTSSPAAPSPTPVSWHPSCPATPPAEPPPCQTCSLQYPRSVTNQ